jgi:hypothetical protein
MSGFERAIIVLAVLVSLLWGAGLTVAYMFRNDTGVTMPAPAAAPNVSPTPSAQPASPEPSQSQTPPPPGDPGASIFSAVSRPPSAPPDPATDDKRKYLTQFWNENLRAAGSQPHGRMEDRTGALLDSPKYIDPPTTQPDTRPSLDPMPITLHLANQPARAALAAFGRAANAKIALLPRGAWNRADFQPVSFDTDNKPLLEVLNQLCCKLGIASGVSTRFNWNIPALADPATPLMTLQLQGADEGMGPWAISGPFGFEVTQINHSAPINSGPTPSGTLNLSISVIHEPRIIVLGETAITVKEAVDDRGNNLVSQFIPAFDAIGDADGQIMAGLSCPPNYGHTITRFTGFADFLIRTSAKRIEVPVSTNGAVYKTTINGAEITISGWQRNGSQQTQCMITLSHPGVNATRWARASRALANLHPVLLDASGNAFPAGQGMNMNSSLGTASCTYLWIQQYFGGDQNFLTPAKLVVDIPTGFAMVQVPIHFENLPLP